MATRKLPGLYWDKETGKGSIDKRIAGYGRVRCRFTASSWQEAEAEYYRAITASKTVVLASNVRTFREAATKYLNEETKRSVSRDADCLANLEPWLGNMKLEEIHQGSLQPYIAYRREKGIKSSTVTRELAVVRRILTLASRVWRDSENKPWLATAPLLRMPDWEDAAKPYPLSMEEQRTLMKELPTHLEEMTLFALNTGARESIICGLRWEWEVKVPELSTSVFAIPGRYTKNRTDCLIVLNSTSKSIIESRRGQDEIYVFGYKGKALDRIHNSGWKSAWIRAGLPVGAEVLSGPHNLRHTFARRLRIAGVPLETRKALMHHIDGDITIHYSPADLKELIDAVEKLCQVQSVTMLRVAR